MADVSPSWKKPSDIMKLRRKKRRLENGDSMLSAKRSKFLSSMMNLDDDSSSENIASPLYRPRNPFRRTSFTNSAAVSIQNDTNNIKNSIKLFDALDESEQKVEALKFKYTEHSKLASKIRESEEQVESPVDKEVSETGICYEDSGASYNLPVDWSLKQKIRFISSLSFDWCKHLKTSEEADGIKNYLSNQVSEIKPMSKVILEDSWKSSFQKECLYWIHPNLPWMKMFPRILAESPIDSHHLGDQIYSSLLSDWSQSFHSAFSQLRSGHCPYVYLCTHQFTVLLRRAKAGSPLTAVVTPTTRGIREALIKEGIRFRMPYHPKYTDRLFGAEDDDSQVSINSSSESSHSLSPAEEDMDGETDLFDEDDNNDQNCDPNKQISKPKDQNQEAEDEDDYGFTADEGAAVWLESMGLDKKNFPSLDPRKVKLRREGFKEIDTRPESTLFLEQDVDVHALFNFLLNWKACVAAAGPQLGIPPTILAPTGFKGAVLKSLQVKHCTVLQSDKQKAHVLEIIGPMLPCHIQGLVDLVKQTQRHCFSLSLNTHEPTVALNVRINSNLNQSDQNSTTQSSDFTFLDFTSKKAIRDVTCTLGGLSWG